MKWNHFMPSGFIENYFRIDPDDQDLEFFSSRYYNDYLKADVGIRAFRSSPKDNYRFTLEASKRFVNTFVSSTYNPEYNDFGIRLSQRYNNFNFGCDFQTYNDRLGLYGTYYINPNLSISARASKRSGQWEYFSGLNVTFNTGTSRGRRETISAEVKPIDWKN